MPLICYLVRHSQTEWNSKGLLQGHLNSPLTELGIKNATEKGKLLGSLGIKKIYSSNLGRCMQTTEIVNKFINAPIVFTNQLRERSYGDFEGKHRTELLIDSLDLMARPSNGESMYDVKERVLPFVKGLEKTEPLSPILLVAHGGVVRVLLSEALQKDIRDPACTPAQDFIGRFEIENGKLQNFELIK